MLAGGPYVLGGVESGELVVLLSLVESGGLVVLFICLVVVLLNCWMQWCGRCVVLSWWVQSCWECRGCVVLVRGCKGCVVLSWWA